MTQKDNNEILDYIFLKRTAEDMEPKSADFIMDLYFGVVYLALWGAALVFLFSCVADLFYALFN